MSKEFNTVPAEVVREACLKFLAVLDSYVTIWAKVVPPGNASVSSNFVPAAKIWSQVVACGVRLLQMGQEWEMDRWVEENPVWIVLELSGFFVDLGPGETEFRPDLESLWGANLARLLAWSNQTVQPFGLSSHEDESLMLSGQWVIDDVRNEVKALLAMANEQKAGFHTGVDTRPPLSPTYRAVLDLIPHGTGKGITGPQIIERLHIGPHRIEQSTLTKNIMPVLKAYYGVENRRGVGYYRS